MYPYHLGYHIPTKRLCRIPAWGGKFIPRNCVKVIRYKLRVGSKLVINPYELDGTLKASYWAIPRSWDLEVK